MNLTDDGVAMRLAFSDVLFSRRGWGLRNTGNQSGSRMAESAQTAQRTKECQVSDAKMRTKSSSNCLGM